MSSRQASSRTGGCRPFPPVSFASFVGASLLVCLMAPARAFDLEDVTRTAQALAERPYSEPSATLPSELTEITYDQFRDIRFRTENSLWRAAGLPFEVQFFHPGLYFRHPVRINEITADGVEPIPFESKNFHYGKNTFDTSKFTDVGFAGFRVHYPINTDRYKDEVAVFLGASYFRALGAGQRYGLSARGLAVDTAEPSGEEFPEFREFWLERPDADAGRLVVYALLDSRRMTGAYRFVIVPGVETVVEVEARIIQREKGAKAGIAPLTSMYFFGENQRSATEDYRPEVHDSDGLLIHAPWGEWIWRPLVNPRHLLVTSFAIYDPRGFGLLQRDRAFPSYFDLEARYELRPSAWIVPIGDWGEGRVELVQIPSPDETHDNIVAYWVPKRTAEVGEIMTFEYRLAWQRDEIVKPPHGWVAQSRRGHGWRKENDDSLLFMIDFEGPALEELTSEDDIEAAVWLGEAGELLEHQAFPNEADGGWRVSLRMRRREGHEKHPVEMRINLRHDGRDVSETWSYLLPPP